MTFLTQDGPTVVESAAVAVTINGEGVVHGNAAVNGNKYQLTFLTFPNARKKCLLKGILDVNDE